MNNNNLFNLIQLITGFALLIGLVLVFVELRQAKELSLAELTSEGYAEAMADYRTLMGENPAPTIAKSCFSPETLEPEDHIVLTAYYSSQIAQISRLRVLELVAQYGVPWQVLAQQQLQGVLDTEPGRTWFKRNFRVDSELYAIGQEIMTKGLDCTNRAISLVPPNPEASLDLDLR